MAFDAGQAIQGAILGFLSGRNNDRENAQQARNEGRLDKRLNIEQMLADARMDALDTELDLNKERLDAAKRANDPRRVAEFEQYDRELRAAKLATEQAREKQLLASAGAYNYRAAGGGGRPADPTKDFKFLVAQLQGKRDLLEKNLELAIDGDAPADRIKELQSDINALDVQLASVYDMAINPMLDRAGVGPEVTPQPEGTPVADDEPQSGMGFFGKLLSGGAKAPTPQTVVPKATPADIASIPGGLVDPRKVGAQEFGKGFGDLVQMITMLPKADKPSQPQAPTGAPSTQSFERWLLELIGGVPKDEDAAP